MPIKRVFIYGYKRGSKSIRLLRDKIKSMGFRACSGSPNSPRVPKNFDLVLTWGTSRVPDWVPKQYINTPDKIRIATDKLLTFQKLLESNLPIPEFTVDIEEAKSWLPKRKVVCRTLLRSREGRGIIIAESPEQVVPAPLYVKYCRKTHEYRVHVWKGTIIDVSEKRKRLGSIGGPIRNHANGWVFCHNNVNMPVPVGVAACNAVSALNLDFGAVDVIWNQKTGKEYILEVNTAPGITGMTINKYVEATLG